MKSDLDEIKHKALPFLQQAGVTRSSIFGSFARGEQTKQSDIDILVELPKDKSLLDLIGLEMNLKTALGRNVDLTTYRSISPYLQSYIQQNQVRIIWQKIPRYFLNTSKKFKTINKSWNIEYSVKQT